MAVTRSRRLAITQRRHQVADLSLQCWTQTAIAEELGFAQSTVCDDLKVIRRQWRDSTIRDFDEARAIELKKIERREREAWTAWEKSKQPAESSKITTDGTAKKAEKSIKNQCGDPRFLDQLDKCSVARRELLGLDAPKCIAPTTPDGQPLSLEQRNAHILAILVEQSGDFHLTSAEVIDEPQTTEPQTIEASASEPQRRRLDPPEPAAPVGQNGH